MVTGPSAGKTAYFGRQIGCLASAMLLCTIYMLNLDESHVDSSVTEAETRRSTQTPLGRTSNPNPTLFRDNCRFCNRLRHMKEGHHLTLHGVYSKQFLLNTPYHT
jgi:hypothetical protein